jgi:hypothetical protein
MRIKPNTSVAIIYISFLLLLRCGSEIKKDNQENTETIKVYENSVAELQTSKLLGDIEYIPLKTKEECLIGKVEKMQYLNNKVYILDAKSTKKLFVFDLTGKCKFSIDNYGRGPGEYSTIMDFSVDKTTGHIYILDFPLKISEYDTLGSHVKDYPLPKTNIDIVKFMYADNGFYLCSNRLDRNVKSYNIIKTDKNMNIKERFLKYDVPSDYIYHFKQLIYPQNNSFNFVDVFEGKIYTKKKDKMKLKYVFDFDGRYMPIEKMSNNSVYMEEFQNYALMQDVLVEGDSTIYYLILNKTKYKHGLYNKITKQNVLIEKIVTDKDIFRMPECFYKGYFYSYVNPITIINNSDHFNGMDKRLSLDFTDNPVLIKYKFKDVWRAIPTTKQQAKSYRFSTLNVAEPVSVITCIKYSPFAKPVILIVLVYEPRISLKIS